MRNFARLGVALAVPLLSISAANAAAVRFDAVGDQILVPNDDLSTGLVDIGFTVNFFGSVSDQLYVNNNGNVTFDAALGTYTPFNLTSTSREIIAAFFGDVDTRDGLGIVSYGQVSVGGRDAFSVTYRDVGYFSRGGDLRNTFQIILIDRSDTGEGNFDIEFNYDRIEWETGGASGGSGGLGGNSARVGYSNGTGEEGTFFELMGSAVNGAFLDTGDIGTALILNSLGSTVDGRYVFNARAGQITEGPEEPEMSAVPLPGAAAFLLTGLIGAAIARRRAA